MSKADELFRNLKLAPTYEPNGYIRYYAQYERAEVVHFDTKTQSVFCSYFKMSPELVKAIYLKTKELGWTS